MNKWTWGLLVLIFLPFLFFVGGTFSVLLSISLLSSPKSSGFLPLTSTSNSQNSFNAVYQLYASPPPVLGAFTSRVQTADARATILEQFFAKYHSPLAAYGQVFIDLSEKYGLPWQLLPAISMQESLGGKNIPEDSYNPFGWGIHSSGTLKFASWQEGIEKVAKGFKEKYIDNGLVTIEDIMRKYNPTSYNRDGSWGNGVQFFLDEIESFNTP